MCIAYEDYKKLGYAAIPEEQFARYIKSAEQTVRRFINNYYDGGAIFSDENKRGICEIADFIYAENNQLNRQVAGFSNENYREQYFEGERPVAGEKVWEIMSIYFTREQLFRGV